MSREVAGALAALAALVACKPAVRGLCANQADCRQGSYCSLHGICLASSGTCSPACLAGEICSGSTCAALMPTISVVPPAAAISPASPQITVRLDAASAVVLHGLSVEVDSDVAVASGSIASPQPGDNLVTLASFKTGVVGAVSVRATLTWLPPGASSDSELLSVAQPATIDAAAPAVSVFVPAATDAVNGWVPRTTGNLEVRATADDGAGTGAQSATLTFDTCPAAFPCSYPGVVVSTNAGATVYSFQVPREVQAAGSEAALPVTVKATDGAGNTGQGTASLQIDDAAPQIAPFTIVSPGGVGGEDGKTWFSNAADLEIAVPVTEQGSGLASVTLHLTDPGMPPDPAGTQQSDGWHFILSASHVTGREGPLSFTISATDKLSHLASSASDVSVDAKPPALTPPHVVYSSATQQPAPCGPAETQGVFNCGRQSASVSPHLLRDDTATITFDALDCGSGIPGSIPVLAVTSGGQTKTVAAQKASPPTDAGTCTNGSPNKLHHYTAQVSFADNAPALDAPDASGTVQVRLASSGADRAGNGGQSPAGTASPDGIALLSLWRWKAKLPAVAAGSPALAPGTAGARTVVVSATGSAPNLFALGPDGTPQWNATLSPNVVGDVAVGAQGAAYVSASVSCGATSSCTAVNVVAPPGGSTGTPVACQASSVTWGASPAIGSSSGSDVVYAVATARLAGIDNLYSFAPGASCTKSASATVAPVTDDVAAVSAGLGAVFASNNNGFTSVDQNGAGFSATQVQFEAGLTTSTVVAAPSTSSDSGKGGAFFGTTGGTPALRRTVRTVCGAGSVPCWEVASGFPLAGVGTGSNLPFTPVFDGTTLWTIDDQGVVYTWAQQTGATGSTLDLLEPASPPVLLQGPALVVTQSGLVKVLTASGAALSALTLLDVAPGSAYATSRVPPPVVDCRTSACSGTGVAYVSGPSGWLWAVQVPAPPLASSTTVWPRPAHDSCNTRNSAESWCP